MENMKNGACGTTLWGGFAVEHGGSIVEHYEVDTRPKRWLKLFAPAAIIVVVVIIAYTRREPSANGHPLSYWLEIALDSSADKSAKTNANKVIKQIGSTCIPALLDKLQADDKLRAPIARRWNELVNALAPFAWLNRLEMEEHRARQLQEQAMVGFELLGTNAASAVPALQILSRDGHHAYDAAVCLGLIRTDEALQVLISLLSDTNSSVRQRSISEIIGFEERAMIAAEKIIPLRNDPDEGVARNAIEFIARFLPAELAIPLLTEKFHDRRAVIVRGAVGAFWFGGPLAEPVMPVIAQVLTNPDEVSRKIATNVLISINPYRAPEFGVATNGVPDRSYKIYRRVLGEHATNSSGRLPR